jgi:hypothetical protein
MENTKPSESQSQDAARKQESVEGQRKEVNVEDYAEASDFGQLLKDVQFPASKDQILNYVRSKGNDELLSKLERIQEKQYMNVSEIARAAGIVS